MTMWNTRTGSRGAIQALVTVVISILACGTSFADSPNLSPPALLPGDNELSPAAGLQEQPAIAMGDEYSLAVWTDARTAVVSLSTFTGGPFLLPGTGTMRDIYAARLDAAGNLVDAIPIVVNSGNLNQGFPAVAWNGQNWLVVWMGQSGLACCANINIYATRVSPEGIVLDNPPIVIDTDPTTSGLYWPCIASDGTNWAVAWRDLDQQAGIFTIDGARVSSDGVVLDPGGKSLRHDTWNSYPIGPQLAFAGDEYLLVWNENSDDVKAQRLTPGLDRIGTVFQVNLLSPTSGKNPDVATDGSSFFVAWFEDRYYGWAQLYGARISHSGQVLDPASIPVSPVSGYTQFDPAVAWDGEQWIVAYNMQSVGFNDDLFTTRVSSSGQVLDPSGAAVATGPASQLQPDIAAIAGGGARLVWHASDYPVLKDDIFAGSIAANATTGPVTCISLGTPRQRSPEFVWNGDGYLAVFLSEISGISRVVGQRIDPNGVPLDQEPFEIASGTSLVRPSAAWDGTRYLVAWSVATESKVYSRRIAPDGTPIDAIPQLVMLGDAPDVAAMNGVFLVTATRAQNPHFRYPYAIRIRGSDGLLIDSQPVLLGSYYASHPSVARLGDRWLVAWQENPTHDDVHSNIAANFVEANGTAGAQFYVTSTSITIETEPCVAAATDTALILWANGPTGAYNDDVKARRILSNGTLLDGNGINVSPAPGLQNQPAAAWNGAEYAVLFSDFRNDDPNGPYVGDVYGARVSGDGALIDLGGFAVMNEPATPEMEPTTAAALDQAALGCTTFQIGSPYAAYRIGYRILNPSATGVNNDAPAVADLGRVLVAPNPSNGAAIVTFYAGGREAATASVFDAQGRVVRSLRGEVTELGIAHLTWDGRNFAGGRVAPGIYFVRARTGSGDRVAKVLRR